MKQSLCIIQARVGSTRFPRKVLMKVGSMTLLEYQIKRIQQAIKIDKIIVATTKEKADDAIVALCKKIGVDCFRGPTEDVLTRYWQCAQEYPEYDIIVRMTADNSLSDPRVIDEAIKLFEEGGYAYTGTHTLESSTFPDGISAEVFRRETLEDAYNNARLASEREHVTLYIKNNKNIKKAILNAKEDNSGFRVTVDYPEDFKVVKWLIEHGDINDPYEKFLALLKTRPDIARKNAHIKYNEGLAKSLREDKEVQPPLE